LLMRQDKTLKVCLNHVVNPLIELQSNAGSDRSWVWRSTDYADPEQPKDETFAVRFQNSEIAQKFKDEFNAARESNKQQASKGEQSTSASNANANAANAESNQPSTSTSSSSAAGGTATTSSSSSSAAAAERANLAATAPEADRGRTLDSESTIAAPKGDTDQRSIQATETDKPGSEALSSEEYASGRTAQSTAAGLTQDPSSQGLTNHKAQSEPPSDATQ